jgi:hypothetical protein
METGWVPEPCLDVVKTKNPNTLTENPTANIHPQAIILLSQHTSRH